MNRIALTRHTRRHKPHGETAAAMLARLSPQPATAPLRAVAPATVPMLIPGLRPEPRTVVWSTTRPVPLGVTGGAA